MRWFKSFLIFVLVGVYFLNHTPAHFLLHENPFKTEKHHKSSNDCEYAKAFSNGENAYINPDILTFGNDLLNHQSFHEISDVWVDVFKINDNTSISLRAPPLA